MTWSLPQPVDISDKYLTAYEGAFKGIVAREPNSFTGVQAKVHGQVTFDLYLYQRSLADELMIDKAQDWLPRHANTWGVPRIPATKAIGNVIFSGPVDLALPADIEIVADADGTQWITTTAATVGSDGTATIPVVAEATGSAGNRAAGTVLTIISTVLGLQLQTVTVDPSGLAGGGAIEDFELWRARVLERVRKRGAGGDKDDYMGWAADAGVAAAYTNVVPAWTGLGTVGIVVAMPNVAGGAPLVPTGPQIAAIQASIDEVRPVTAQAIVVAYTPHVVPLTIALKADTVANRAQAAAAAARFFLQIPIGGLLEQDLLQNAIIRSVGSGLQLPVPAGDVQAGRAELLVLGAIAWGTYAT